MAPARSCALLAAAIAAAAITPAASAASLEIRVPTAFLGGPIWRPALFAPGQLGPAPAVAGQPSRSPAAAPCSGPCVLTDDDATVERSPVVPLPDGETGDTDGIPDGVSLDDAPAGDAPVTTPRAPDPPEPDLGPTPAAGPVPEGGPAPALAPSSGDVAAAFRGLVSPSAAGWLRWETPVLRWKRAGAAGYYNVQIFRGARRVLNAWTTGNRLRVPDDVLDQGRSYVWVVWPGIGRRAAARYGPAVGRSTFAVTLRPRVVLRAGAATAEVRPRIPGGVLRVTRPGGRAQRLTISPDGTLRLRVPPSGLRSLRARLVDRGPAPPVGLRG